MKKLILAMLMLFITATSAVAQDMVFTSRIQSRDNGPIGVVFRYQDNQNFYRFSWNAFNSWRRLEKVQAGVLTVLAEDGVPYVSRQWYTLAVSAKGSVIEVRIDGQLVFAVADSAIKGNTVGLYSNRNAYSMYDDVTVKDLADNILFSDDFSGVIDKWSFVGTGTWAIISGAATQTTNSDTLALASFTPIVALPPVQPTPPAQPDPLPTNSVLLVERSKLVWLWQQGQGGLADEFIVKCGREPGVYTKNTTVLFPDKELALKDAIDGYGQWYCVVTAANPEGESGPSNEYGFIAATAVPEAPVSFGGQL